MSGDRWTTLARVMAAGAVYDFAFGAAILVAPETSSRLLRLPLPADRVYLDLNGVFLLLLAALYALPARDPRRFHAIAPIAATGRGLGAALLIGAFAGGRPGTFALLGAADLAVGLVTAAVWWRARAAPAK